MTGVLAALIAVAGTLGGVVASYFFQGKISKRSESLAQQERSRQESLSACSAFAGAVMDLRGVQYERASTRLLPEDRRRDRSAVIAESSRLRSVAWTAFYRFKLTSPDSELTRLAEQAVQDAADVSDASDRNDLKSRSELARKRIDEFTCAAAAYLDVAKDLAGVNSG
jgi:hypothetical protein